jgi:RNA polymerase sigma factor (sigma-70 family)
MRVRAQSETRFDFARCRGRVTRSDDVDRMRALTDKTDALSADSALSERFAAPLLSYFLRRIRDRTQAEDLVQDVLLRVIRARESGAIENPESYVFKVAANLLKDLRRRAGRHPILVPHSIEGDPLDGPPETLVDERSPERVLIGQMTLAGVLKALEELSEPTRNVFILFRLEQMKQKDIATLLGISQGSVEKHVMKAALHLTRRCAQP